MIRFSCGSCKAVMEAPESKAGATGTCPRCKKPFRIPAVASPVKAAAPPRPTPVVAVPAVPASASAPLSSLKANPKLLAAGAGGMVLLVIVMAIGMSSSGVKKKASQPLSELGEVPQAPIRPAKETPVDTKEGDVVADLSSPEFDTRLRAAVTLDKQDKVSKAAIKPLIELLKDRTDSNSAVLLRQIAARSLGKIGPDARPAMEDLRIALGDPNVEVRFAALESIGKLGKDGVAPIMDTLGDAKLQLKACDVLARYGDDARPAVATMVEVMRTVDPDFRVQVAACIVKIDRSNEAVLPVLIAGLKNSNDTTRRAAVLSLGMMGPAAKSAENTLYDVATMDLNEEVKELATEAYRKIGGGK